MCGRMRDEEHRDDNLKDPQIRIYFFTPLTGGPGCIGRHVQAPAWTRGAMTRFSGSGCRVSFCRATECLEFVESNQLTRIENLSGRVQRSNNEELAVRLFVAGL
jgi:hypothetical protein